jgi:L-2-hydroxyglutarate oxidase LhgO
MQMDKQNGLDFLWNSNVESIAKQADGSLLVKTDNGAEIEADCVM